MHQHGTVSRATTPCATSATATTAAATTAAATATVGGNHGSDYIIIAGAGTTRTSGRCAAHSTDCECSVKPCGGAGSPAGCEAAAFIGTGCCTGARCCTGTGPCNGPRSGAALAAAGGDRPSSAAASDAQLG